MIKYETPPIIVVGTGRCGSSMLAGMLSKLGVDMGCQPGPHPRTNPWGHYEDFELMQNNEKLLDGKQTHKGWAAGLKDRIERRPTDKPWGFKDPRIADLVEHYKTAFPDAIWIWAWRELQDSINSTIAAYQWPESEKLITERHTAIANRCSWALRADFELMLKAPLYYARLFNAVLHLGADNATVQHAADHVVPEERRKHKEKLRRMS